MVNSKQDMRGYIITQNSKTSILVVVEAGLWKGGSGTSVGEEIGLNERKVWLRNS